MFLTLLYIMKQGQTMKKLNIKKIDNRLALKIIWAIMIWLCTVVYFHMRWDIILQTELGTVDKLIGSVFLLITLLPLISEIDIFGFKVIKDMKAVESKVEAYHTEMSHKILEVKQNITNQNVSTVTTTLNVPYIDGIACSATLEPEGDTNLEVTEEQVFCFKVRTAIEQLLKRIAKSHKMEWDGKNFVPLGDLRSFREQNIIEEALFDDVQRVIILCNRSIHGEILPPEYREYIELNYRRIITELEKIAKLEQE